MNRKPANLSILAAFVLGSASLLAAEAPVPDTSERDALSAKVTDAIAAKEYKAIAEKATELWNRTDSNTLRTPSKSSLPGIISEAKIRAAGKFDFQTFQTVTAADAVEFKINDLALYRSQIARTLNLPEIYKSYVAFYREDGKNNPQIGTIVGEMLKSSLNDPQGAFTYARERGDHRTLIGLLQYAGYKFTKDDPAVYFASINALIDDPAQTIDPSQAKDWASTRLVNLYTTGKIKKEQFVGTLKKLYKRCYLNLGKNRDQWEPVIAAIKFGIVNADKIATLGD